MKIFFTLLVCIFAVAANAQISATTSSGRKVMLNTDGTWKYADGSQEEKPCNKNHTGNISIKNATGNDIYFYYTYSIDGKAAFVKIKANSTKAINDLIIGNWGWDGKITETHNYKWKALLELVETTYSFDSIKGAIETGSFMVDECGLKEVSVGE